MKQTVFSFADQHWKHRYQHGGILRNKRAGRKDRPISTKDPIHLVMKANREVMGSGFRLPQRFTIITAAIKKYSKKFGVKIENHSINGDHLHFLVRISHRSFLQSFMKVVAGQIAQIFMNSGLFTVVKKEGSEKMLRLWKYRPFTRVIKGYQAYQIVLNYVQLNVKEASGEIKYKKDRLKGLRPEEWDLLWA